ncbi:TonB-linked SusC/RagA family outer membrane protein [Pedobacter cryoconitis]|uniref:TonB-linked SusC/RagA family outer membrane protein n=1 Tax=Pedobacter cryoconitis TaxID=188932 RepID=A0A7W9DZC2_9SPHI|nr:TonB-dependent receptor [Pedobacter cryoconitis]MBB5636099.1 TonB-linked SusC/RagA family outer membrane protein [Pedobacter cryoconitis]
MTKNFTLFIICLLCGISVALAQNINIKGEVKDHQGLPLPGVSVKVKGTNNGVVTSGNGSYTLSAPANSTLIFSFIGYKTIEEAISNRKNVSVKLADDNQQLNEVIVVGYGTQTKKDLTTAVSSISAKDIQNQPVTNALQALQGKAAGVQVTSQSGKPGAGISVSIRGNTSLTASNSPLYVINGVTSRDASFINPNDIETMTILKDASAAAIYGSSGANGVVLITTKKGTAGQVKVGFNAFTGISNFWRKQKVLNSDQYISLMKDLGYTEFGGTQNTDWQKEAFGTGQQNNYQLSLSGGTKGGQYYLSSGYQQDKGVVAPAKLDRYSFNFNGSQRMTSWLKFNVTAALTSNKSIDVSDNAGISKGGVILAALTTPPTLTIFDPNGNYTPVPGGYENPIGNAFGSKNTRRQLKFIGAFGGEINFNKDLVFKSTISTNVRNEYYDYTLDPFKTVYGRTERGIYNNNKTNDHVWLNENILSYNKTIGKNVFGAMAGYTIQESDYTYLEYSATRFVDQQGLPIAPSIAPKIPQRSQWAKQSYLARVNYAFDGKYLLSSNFRADGSSRFAPGHKFGYFPSVSAGWRISGENFMKDSKTINDLKIRGSWGKVGNDEGIGDYAYMKLYQITAQNSYTLDQPANDQLSWEKTTQTNIGIDLTMFDSRLTFTADAYLKKTNDLLVKVQLPTSSGLGTQALNVGSMENKGLEFALSTKNIVKSKFTWSTDLNFSLNRNKVTSLGNTTQSLDYGGIFERDAAIRVVVGRPLGSIYGYVFTGVDPKTGNATYQDTNNNGQRDNGDRQFIGSAQPKFTYGINNNFTYGNFGLSVFFQGVQGNQLFNASRIELEGMYDAKNQSAAVLNRWTTPGQITDIPKAQLTTSSFTNTNSLTSSRFVENASYLRLKTATLSYNFGKTALGKLKMDKLTIFATGYNILTFTKYSGLDPEVSRYDANGPDMGVDYGTYPQSRSFLLGVNVGF